MQLPPDLQKELVEKAAAKCGNCQELARHLDIPKSSVHYYMVGRLTIPRSVLDRMIEIAADESLSSRVNENSETKDRMWAIWNAKEIFIESCKERVTLPTVDELHTDDGLRRKAAAIISYVQAEGSVWMMKDRWSEQAVNITFADHEEDLYEHFRSLCKDVFRYDIGPFQSPGNGARAIRGFIYSRFVAEWIVKQGVPPGDKASQPMHVPRWVLESRDPKTWAAALQPWCDGEGCVHTHPQGGRPGFVLTQSRHTSMDFNAIPPPEGGLCRTVPSGYMKGLSIYGIPFMDYCKMVCRSEAFDDVALLFRRRGLNPKLKLYCMYLKDDGYWSAHWAISFRAFETDKLLSLGLITQSRKMRRAGFQY